MSGKCSGHVQQISGKSLGNFPDNFQDVYRKFAGYFQEMSKTFPGKFLGYSDKNPGYVQDISTIFSGKFPGAVARIFYQQPAAYIAEVSKAQT